MNIYKGSWMGHLPHHLPSRWVVFVAWSQDPFAMWGGQRSQRKRTHALHSHAQANRSVWSRIGIVTLHFFYLNGQRSLKIIKVSQVNLSQRKIYVFRTLLSWVFWVSTEVDGFLSSDFPGSWTPRCRNQHTFLVVSVINRFHSVHLMIHDTFMCTHIHGNPPRSVVEFPQRSVFEV